MSQVIRSASELPGWFSLASYEPQIGLCLAGWLRQLAARTELLFAPLPFTEYELAHLDDIRARPIVPAAAEMLDLNPWTNDLEFQLEGHACAYPPARPMRLRDLLSLEDAVGGDELEEVRGLRRRIYPEPGFPIPDVHDAIEAMKEEHRLDCYVEDWASAHSRSSFVAVDLALPDEVLVDAFRDLIPSLRELAARRAQCLTPTGAKVDPASWAKFAILPYLDLQIWAQEVNVRVPNRVLADAIFLAGEGGEEVVRKTTAKIAAVVTTDAFLRRLVSAAVAQIRNA